MCLSLSPLVQVYNGDDLLDLTPECCLLELGRAVNPSYIISGWESLKLGGFVLWVPRVSHGELLCLSFWRRMTTVLS